MADGATIDARRAWQLAAIAAAVAVLVFAASLASAWRLVELKIFDHFSTLAPPPLSPDSPIIVAIDEPSMAEIGQRWPWPRDLHARLVTALRAAGAEAIGLDIIFSEPSTAAGDHALTAALGPDVVLAADETVIRTPQADQLIRVEPLAAFTASGARSGIVSISLDGDGVVRRVPAYADGFAARLLETAGGVAPAVPAGALIQGFGPPRSFQTVSYYQALDPGAFLPPDAFRGRTVIVGLSMQSAPSVDTGGPDVYATSDTVRSHRLLAGAELQATIFENLGGRHFVMPAPVVAVALAILAAAALAALSVWSGTGRITAAVSIAAVLGIFAASLLLLQYGRVFLAPVAPSLAFAGVAAIQSARDYAAERRRRMRITRAFSQYLSPVLVERLADDVSQLKLGGERRVLTVLFCDVRGFTTISEEMKDDPEGLTRLMNRLLNPLSDVILKAGGTIDKYIGDAIMAFWNAPLEDPDHAVHAIEAALAMLDAVDALNAEREREAAGSERAPTPLRIGVGINSGDCVVGNMGSDFRFNYSALGDPVNLASRLESETKNFGVSILVGEAAARLVGGRIALAELDLVKVKGKSQAVMVSTPVPRATADALAWHAALIADMYAGMLRADGPRFEVLGKELPEVAGFYRILRDRLAAGR
ncbi:CHASE2 domain-containing protein [Kumtagia ephedrae]|uniref:Adenylate/guanylate cyclase domain-containing protein n=1 Tax=Kumtagia ephedrae TaxID=2116701 RepID=A0A2P7S677_9HYPH|nr:CHASE2 domain-containing protein [Mesorhizobium ephedrae]PSJ57978.1 adenylate/guanylate cyclase domain-containing protein [Mesorhizobium ephedrae]